MNTEIILKVMQEQLANPYKAGVNHESAFVASKLRNMGFNEESQKYWGWSCSYNQPTPDWVTDEILDIQNKLSAIDKRYTIPAWGTYGT